MNVPMEFGFYKRRGVLGQLLCALSTHKQSRHQSSNSVDPPVTYSSVKSVLPSMPPSKTMKWH